MERIQLARYYDRKALKKYEETSEVDKTIIGHVFENLNEVHWLAFEIPMNHYSLNLSLDETAEFLACCSFGMTMVLLDPKLYHDFDSKAIVKKYLARLHDSSSVRENFQEALKKWDDFLD